MHKNLRRVSTGLLLVGLSGTSVLAVRADNATPAAPAPGAAAPVAQATATATATAAPDTELQTIVVDGLRESLGRSLNEKRNAEIVQDSIDAIELGRFPDADIADSLRHITGVNITRTTGGEGQYIGIRGLGSQYNIVTLNNRIVATDDDGRALAFDVLPADVISGADVYKSSQASALEGSIGGTVNLRSARPFDNPGLHSSVRLEGDYNDMSEYWGKKGSAFISDTTSDGRWGLLVGAVLSSQKTRTDSLNYNTFDGDNPGVWPLSGPTSAPVVAECCISFGSVVDQKRRDAFSGTLEWRPTDTLHVTIDGLYSRLIDPQVAYNQAYYPDFNYDQNGNPEWSNVVVKNGFITSFTGNTFTPEIVNQTVDRRVTTSLIGANAAWTPLSNFTVVGDVYQSKSNRPEGGNDAFVTSGLESTTPYNQDVINWRNNPSGGLPFISVTLPGGRDYAQALASGALNNNFWTAHYTGLNGNSVHDKVTGGTLDGTLKFDDLGPLSQFRFGVADTSRHKTRDDFDNDWTGGSSQYDFYTTPTGATPITYGILGANVISTMTFPNYMQGAGGSFPTTVAVFNIPALLNALKKLNGQPNTYVAGAPNYDFAASLPQFNAVNSYNVLENTISGYFEAAFSGYSWAGNVGVRVVHTKTTASTAVNEIESVTVANTANPTDPAFVNYSTPRPTTATGSYTLPLPSLNFLYHVRPDLQLRFGASETITRPALDQLAPTRTDNSLNRVYEVDYAGNSQLKPIKAWSADISAEWYYQPKSALTLAIFGKDLKDTITQGTQTNVNLGVQGFFNGATTPVPVLYTVTSPINGDKAYVEGIEFGFQHMLANGFGVHGQFTHTWSKEYVDGQYVGALEGVAPNTASLGVLYEAGPISANVNWDYDGPKVEQTFTEIDGLSAYQDSFSWVTAQVSYEFFKGLKLYVEGENLANAIPRTYLANRKDEVYASGATTTNLSSDSAGTSSAVGQGYTAFGRTFTLGISYRF